MKKLERLEPFKMAKEKTTSIIGGTTQPTGAGQNGHFSWKGDSQECDDDGNCGGSYGYTGMSTSDAAIKDPGGNGGVEPTIASGGGAVFVTSGN